MKIKVTAFFILLTCVAATAQTGYSGRLEAGLTNGSWETNGYVQTAHGLAYKQFFVGVGAGVDYYRYRSVPLFVEVSKAFGKKNLKPYVIGAAGLNYSCPNEVQKRETNGWQSTEATFRNGLYSRAGLGLIFNSQKQVKLAANISWSYKMVTRSYREWSWSSWPQPQNTLTKTIEYRLHRLNIGLCAMF